MNPHHLAAQAGEDQLAGAPGVLEATAGTTVVEQVEHQLVRSVVIQDPLGQVTV